MSDWGHLQQLFQASATARLQAQALEQRKIQARQELEAWYRRVESWLMQSLYAALEERAGELHSLGATVRVQAPTAHALSIGPGEFRRSVQVTFLSAEVLVYSARAQQGPLMVHWARVLRTGGRQLPRLFSVPGFRVRRGAGGEIVLEPVGPEPLSTPFSVSDVALRVLTILVEQAGVARYVREPSRSSP